MPLAVGSVIRGTGRRVVAAVVGGGVAGAAAGVTARLLMYAARLANPSYNGAVTHEGVVNGRWTAAGTSSIVVSAVFVGIFGGGLYLVLRPVLRGGPGLRGTEFGMLLLVVFGSMVLDGSYEYVRFVSTWIAVAAFAALYPWYGFVLGVVAGRIAPSPSHHRWPRLTAVASVALATLFVVRAVEYSGELRFAYFT